MKFDDLPEDALVRAREIVRSRAGPGVVPCGLTKWKAEVAAGRAPKPEFPFGKSVALWRVGKIREYLKTLGQRPSA